MLALGTELVDIKRAEPGNTQPLREILDDLRTGGVAAVSSNGVLGDPEGATAAEGRDLLDALVADLVAHIALA